jgi:hypothetical protein
MVYVKLDVRVCNEGQEQMREKKIGVASRQYR